MKKLILVLLISLSGLFTNVYAGNDPRVTVEVIFDEIQVTAYHDNGSKLYQGLMNLDKERIGTWYGWYDNGQISHIMPYDNYGNKHGHYRIYSEEGTLLFSTHYYHGVRVGTWKMYSEEGQLIQVVFYDNGKRIESICSTN